MKKSFAARRMPRKIGGDDQEDDSPAPGAAGAAADSQASSVVRRPSTKSRKSATARTPLASAFNTDDDDESSSVITPKRGTLSRIAIQRDASSRSGADVRFRTGHEDDEDRPSYSKSYLDELKQSTPSTPRDISGPSTDQEVETSGPLKAVDLASKFGKDISRYNTTSAIPTDAEIREKKERRARMAKEQDFISLDNASDPENESDENVTHDDAGRLILKPKEKYRETRLVRDDEDILEDFDDFTSDGRIALGRKAEREADSKRKAEMAALIHDAEASDGSDEADESEIERNAAFEDAQTRHGTYASRAEDRGEEDRPRTPPRIAPLPTLDGVLERLRSRLDEMQVANMAKRKEMEGLKAEKKNISEEEVRIQNALKETGEKYAKLREEMGVKAAQENEVQVERTNGDGRADASAGRMGLGAVGLGFASGTGQVVGRGLESLGSTPMAGTPLTAGSDSSDDY